MTIPDAVEASTKEASSQGHKPLFEAELNASYSF